MPATKTTNNREHQERVLRKHAPELLAMASSEPFSILIEEVLDYMGVTGQMSTFNEPHLSLIAGAKEEGARKALRSVRATIEHLMESWKVTSESVGEASIYEKSTIPTQQPVLAD